MQTVGNLQPSEYPQIPAANTFREGEGRNQCETVMIKSSEEVKYELQRISRESVLLVPCEYPA